MEEKLTKYHKEEIIFILLILAENLSEYENEDLVCFTEAIEGRIDELFKSEKIILFLKEYEINNEIIQKMQVLEHYKYDINVMTATFWQKNKYDRRGKLKEEKNFLDGELLIIREKYFPKERKLVRESLGKEHNKIIKKYDHNDNLILLEHHKNNNWLSSQRTEIEYFN